MRKRVRSTGHLGYSQGYEYVYIPSGTIFKGCVFRSDMADPVYRSDFNSKYWLRKSERFFCIADEFRKMINNPWIMNLFNEQGGRYFERTIFKRMEEIK